MLSSIIKKELLENIVSYRLPLFFLICAILIVSSLYVHELDYSKRLSDYSEQIRLADDALASSRMWDIHFGTIPLNGFRPPSLLSIFASGLETNLPRFYEFLPEGYKQGEMSVGDQSVLSIFGKFDFVFITDICGTGELDKEKYLDAVRSHQQTLDAALYSHVNKTTIEFPSGGTASSSSINEFVDLKTLPAFSIQRATLSEVVAGNLGSLISLAFWLIAPFAVAYVRFLRYDVR